MQPTEDKLELLIADAIKKCQTHAHRSKAIAGEMRRDGFKPASMGELMSEASAAFEYACLYQGYINARNAKGNN